MNKVFKLKVDQTQNIDDFPNIHKINTEDYPDLSQVLSSEKRTLNVNKIIVKANFLQVQKYDFIANDLNIPIFSPRFHDLIKTSKLKEVKLVPLILIDDTYLNSIFDNSGHINKDAPCLKGFFSLKFNSQHDLCDVEKSHFRKLRSNPDSLGILKNPVLKYQPDGFPKLFRIKESISYLFSSEELVSIVNSNNLKGFLFEEIETTPQRV